MEGLYEWIRNITYYLIFMTVVTNLLPDKKYEKYFRLFAGMVLILLVLKPFTGGLRLDDKLAYYFESISFQKEASELSAQLTDMEGVRLKSMVSQYEEKKETFGHVVSVSLRLASDSSGQADQGGSSSGIQPVEPVEPVEPIEPVERIRVELNGGSEEVSETIGASAGQPDKRQEENSALAGLRRRISEYYDLEEQDIEIQLENR